MCRAVHTGAAWLGLVPVRRLREAQAVVECVRCEVGDAVRRGGGGHACSWRAWHNACCNTIACMCCRSVLTVGMLVCMCTRRICSGEPAYKLYQRGLCGRIQRSGMRGRGHRTVAVRCHRSFCLLRFQPIGMLSGILRLSVLQHQPGQQRQLQCILVLCMRLWYSLQRGRRGSHQWGAGALFSLCLGAPRCMMQMPAQSHLLTGATPSLSIALRRARAPPALWPVAAVASLHAMQGTTHRMQPRAMEEHSI